MSQLVSKHEQTLHGSLKAFLHLRSKDQPGTTYYCPNCGSICMDLPAQFWLDGDQESFSIWLPFCPECSPEIFARVPAVT